MYVTICAGPGTEKLTNIQDIEVQFALMSIEIKEALIKSKVDVVLLIEQLCAISAVRNKNVPLFDKDVFEKIRSIDDFWKELRGLWTIFDYDLLKYIVKISQCNKAQDILSEFLSRIDPSAIEDVDMMLHCKAEHWEGSLKPVLRIKVNAEQCTPKVRKAVEEVVKKTYKLDKYSLHLVCIKKGCIELFYYISRPLKSYLLQFDITEGDIREFCNHNFINLRIDEFVLNIPPRTIDITVSSLYTLVIYVVIVFVVILISQFSGIAKGGAGWAHACPIPSGIGHIHRKQIDIL